MYSDCVTCPKLGKSCDGPRFVSMPAPELMNWCKARKAYLGLSNQKLAEMANMPKGTLDGLLANAHADFRYETIRPVLKVLIGGDWKDDPCPDLTTHERAAYDEKIRQLEKEIQRQEERMQQMRTVNEGLHAHMKDSNAQHMEYQRTMQAEMKRKNKIIALLGTLFGLCLSIIIAALIIDRLNSDVGFFWLRGLLVPTGGENNIIREVSRLPLSYMKYT